ncbi:MAG: hypothetical protein MJA30_11625 [Cytophagales bacterium]|nr:hypothetical protein [Cytophagales bacterium]
MRRFVFMICQFMLALAASGQSPMDYIEERVWELNEFYVDSVSQQDSLCLFFANDNKLVSSEFPGALKTYQNVRVISGLQGAYEYIAPLPGTSAQLRMDDSGETKDFEIVHYDMNNLILITYDTLPGEYLKDGQNYVYPIELRLIPIE